VRGLFLYRYDKLNRCGVAFNNPKAPKFILGVRCAGFVLTESPPIYSAGSFPYIWLSIYKENLRIGLDFSTKIGKVKFVSACYI
jgi:hypothetical protein